MWLSILAFVTFLYLFRSITTATETDFCGRIFETKIDYALEKHTMVTALVLDEFECQLSCLSNDTCQSFNVHPNKRNRTRICELNSNTRQKKPDDFKRKKGSSYYGLVPVSCALSPHHFGDPVNSGKCHPDYKGKKSQTPVRGWSSYQPAHSCKHIRDSGDSKGDGEYWIDPEKNGRPLKVFCDMTTGGGGWLLIANHVIYNLDPLSDWPIDQTYRGISNYNKNQMGISMNALKELRKQPSFTQLRFHCSKQQGRTFHVTTVANSTAGEAVVQYFSGQTDVLPATCGSFQRMDDDDSQLAVTCDQWANEGGNHHVGKWGHYNKKGEYRMYDHAAFVAYTYHWVLASGFWLCDEPGGNPFAMTSGDFWKIFVR